MADETAAVNEVAPGILRTPDECFEGLADFPFAPHYVDVDGYRVHYLDEGPRDAKPILLMHGEPSWCYLYRKMIRVLVAAGHRCIAPDLIGFGKSDKLASRDGYSYQFHADVMNNFLRVIDLSQITLFCQDWGGLIGIRTLTDQPDRYERLVVANTGYPTGDHDPGEAFRKWLHFSQHTEHFPVGGIVNGACTTDLSADVIAAYDAPFPADAYKEGARIFPALVPITPDDPAADTNRAGWKVLSQWPGKVLTLFSDKDPVTKGGFKPFQKLMPGAEGQPHTTIEGAGHFLQEDAGEEVATRIVEWLAAE